MFRAYAKEVQEDAEVAVTAANEGDWAPARGFAAKHKFLILGTLLPLALVLRYPPLILTALRGAAARALPC